jgi:hypothetical protein
MKVIWQEFEELPKALGHGVEFYIFDEEGRREFVAFLEGYELYHGSLNEVVIKIRKASDFKNPTSMDDVKQDIEVALKEKRLWQGTISSRVVTWLNA